MKTGIGGCCLLCKLCEELEDEEGSETFITAIPKTLGNEPVHPGAGGCDGDIIDVTACLGATGEAYTEANDKVRRHSACIIVSLIRAWVRCSEKYVARWLRCPLGRRYCSCLYMSALNEPSGKCFPAGWESTDRRARLDMGLCRFYMTLVGMSASIALTTCCPGYGW